jgi:hypothetical protein
MTTAQYRKEMKQIIADLRKVSALLNSEETIDQVSGLWVKHRIERTNDFLDILIDDLEAQHKD